MVIRSQQNLGHNLAQRLSDGSWVTLTPLVSKDGRLLCNIKEDEAITAVLRTSADERQLDYVQELIKYPPPESGKYVWWTWPIDVLVDAKSRYVGYLVANAPQVRTSPLAAFADDEKLFTIAPDITSRHLFYIARNLAVAVAGLHYVGHGRVRGKHILVDENTTVIVIRTDEFESPINHERLLDDNWRLGSVIESLISKCYVPEDIIGINTSRRRFSRGEAISADKWFHVLREVADFYDESGKLDRPLSELNRQSG